METRNVHSFIKALCLLACHGIDAGDYVVIHYNPRQRVNVQFSDHIRGDPAFRDPGSHAEEIFAKPLPSIIIITSQSSGNAVAIDEDGNSLAKRPKQNSPTPDSSDTDTQDDADSGN